MITGTVMTWIQGFLHLVLGALPTVQVPDWVSNGAGAVSTVFGFVGSMGVWFPGSLALTVISALLAVWLVGFAINAARMVVSLLSGGGGGV